MTNAKTPATQSIRYFWRHASRYPHLLWGMVLTVPVAVLFNRFLPALVLAHIFDRLSRHDFVSGDVWGSFGSDLLLTTGLWALGGIGIWRIVSYCNWKLEGHVVRDIAQEVFDHLLKLSANFHANRFAGTLVSQSSKLTGAYARITDTTIFSVGTLVSSLVFTVVLLAPRAPLFVGIFALFVCVYMYVSILVARKLKVLGGKEAAASTRQTGYLADSVSNILAVKSFSAASYESARYNKSAEKTRGALMMLMRGAMVREFTFTSIGTAINVLAMLMAIVGIMVFHANVATIFLILSYSNQVLLQLWEFSTSALRTYNRAFADSEGMLEVLAVEPDVKDPLHPEAPRITKGAIGFNGMSFTHPDSRQNEALFASLTLHIKPSEKIGLVGHSGSGKTTLTKLLLRFNDIDDGTITIDGQNIANLTQEDLRRHIAYVPQEPLLFHRTVRENIAYGQTAASENDVYEAAKKAYAHDFILKLPEGYDTLVGERGVKLSGGQRQRIAIARAILKDAPILVLDEATSALDSESEKLIQSALWELMKERTAIVIAHRLSTIQKMDRIVVLDDGNISEQGTHHNLLKSNGPYAKLWAHQSGGFIEE